MTAEKFVIAKSFYGLGGNLAVLACAWLSAKKLERQLVVDWRGGHYGGKEDYFEKLFKRLDIQSSLRYVSSTKKEVFPLYWNEFFRDIPTHRKGYTLTAASSDLLFDPTSGFSDTDHGVAVVARDGSFFHKADYKSEIREFFQNLTPVDEIETSIIDFIDQNFNHPVIGVHFRHGNGEATVVPPDFQWFCKQIDDFVERDAGGQVQIFLATDCSAALSKFEHRYGGRILHFPKIYPALGGGGMHYKQSDEEKLMSAIEALIDIRILSRCDAFIGSKSFFSACANLWGGGFNKENSRWFFPRLRSFKPAATQVPASSDAEVLRALGEDYLFDNVYVDQEAGDIAFQDIVIGNKEMLISSPKEVEAVKQKIAEYRLY